ncbi:MAG: NUDIX domain-containing protein [Bacteroidetes bacterium]|nr:NUDIX domain-containing protein [Bacteroidota bacterium]
MPISSHMRELRSLVGTRLVQVPSVAAVIHDAAGRLLLQRRASDGNWSLPAGAIDPGERPADAVVREVREETGLNVLPVSILGVFGGERFRHVYGNGDEVEYLVVLFRCEITGGDPGGEDGETLELAWYDVDAMPPLTLPYPRELLRAGARTGTRAFFES